MEYANQQETEAVNSKGLKHSSFLNEKSDCLAFCRTFGKNSIEFLKILGCILYNCLKINISAAIKLNCNNYKQINIRW